LSEGRLLVINVSQIPSEGLDVEDALEPGEVHLEGEDSFILAPGGRMQGRLERGEEDSVHVRGSLSARLGLQCGRCLEPFDLPVDQELDLFYLRRQRADPAEEEDEVELSDRDMVVAYYKGDILDLGEMVREQFFLALPLKRLCREDCRGLCLTCGANRNVKKCDCPPEAATTPFGSLRRLFEDKDR
jgi:uncharacterized protein